METLLKFPILVPNMSLSAAVKKEENSKMLIVVNYHITAQQICLQFFDAVGGAAGRAIGLEKSEWCVAGVVVCLEQRAKLTLKPTAFSLYFCMFVGF